MDLANILTIVFRFKIKTQSEKHFSILVRCGLRFFDRKTKTLFILYGTVRALVLSLTI